MTRPHLRATPVHTGHAEHNGHAERIGRTERIGRSASTMFMDPDEARIRDDFSRLHACPPEEWLVRHKVTARLLTPGEDVDLVLAAYRDNQEQTNPPWRRREGTYTSVHLDALAVLIWDRLDAQQQVLARFLGALSAQACWEPLDAYVQHWRARLGPAGHHPCASARSSRPGAQ